MELFTCTPCTYLVSKWGLGEVESGFVLISEMTQQLPEEPGLLLESPEILSPEAIQQILLLKTKTRL